MLKNRKALLDQLDNLAMFNTLEHSDLYLKDTFTSEHRDYCNDTDADMSDASRYTDTFNDNLSIGTTDTKVTDIAPSILPSMKALPELPKQTCHNHRKFQEQLQIGLSNARNMTNVLDCVEDLLVQENQIIEAELAKIVREIEDSVPNNTFIIPARCMFSMRPKKP